MKTISNAIAWWAALTPDQVALRFGADSVTFRELRDWSERIAADLISAGISRGQRVGICALNSIEYCALIHGIIRAGAIVSPMNMRYTTHELSEMIEDLGSQIIFTDTERRTKFDKISVELRDIADIATLREGERVIVSREPLPEDPVVIISTSGSTAKPKGVVLTNQSMMDYVAAWALEEPECTKGSRVIVPAPLNTSAGFVQLIHYSSLGCTLYFESAFDPEVFLEKLVSEKINFFGAVPVFFERIAASPNFASADLSAIQTATTGGARVSQALQNAWVAKGVVLRQMYGQTEAGGNATIMPKDQAVASPDKCGRGGIFTQLAIVDEDGRELPFGQTGQILVRGPGIMAGYWNNPEETEKTIRNGWLYTGDLGFVDEQGYLTFVDRMKDIIISGGLNISAAEVERSIMEFGGIEEVMVIAAKDDRFGETPMAVVYAQREIDVKELIAHCNRQLADYKVPRYVVFESEPMPRTATGKLAKPSIREKYINAGQILEKVR